jgi:hypothetical protein
VRARLDHQPASLSATHLGDAVQTVLGDQREQFHGGASPFPLPDQPRRDVQIASEDGLACPYRSRRPRISSAVSGRTGVRQTSSNSRIVCLLITPAAVSPSAVFADRGQLAATVLLALAHRSLPPSARLTRPLWQGQLRYNFAARRRASQARLQRVNGLFRKSAGTPSPPVLILLAIPASPRPGCRSRYLSARTRVKRV